MVSVVNNVTNYKVSSLSMVNYAITLLIQVFGPACLPHAWSSGNALAKGTRGAGFKSRQNQCEKNLTWEDFDFTFFGLLMTQILCFARLFSRVPTFYLNPF